MARISFKKQLIQEFPYLENYILTQWEYYQNEDEEIVGTKTQENIADNIRIDIDNCGLYCIEEAKRQGVK